MNASDETDPGPRTGADKRNYTMRKLAKIAAPALAAIAALGAVAPASAQDWGRGGYHEDYRDDYRGDYRGGGWRGDRGLVRQFSQQIDQLEQYGRGSRFIQERVYTLRNALRNWSRDGLSQHEARTLRQQIDLTYRQANGRGRDDYRDGYGRDGYRGW